MQNQLHEGLRPFSGMYRNAGNEILKSEVYRKAGAWRRDFAASQGYEIKGWEGVISDISTNKGGDLASVSIRSGVRGFWVYYKSGLVIKRGSRLYTVLEAMAEGDSLTFSGNFLPAKAKGYREMSLTERGSLDEPWFQVVFTDIRRSTP